MDSPKEISEKIGKNIRNLRILRGISQKRLGKKLGVTFQQIQKYETGANRISAAMLYRISKHFAVSFDRFFSGIEDSNNTTGIKDESHLVLVDVEDRMVLLVSKYLSSIKNKETKSAFARLLKTVSKSEKINNKNKEN